MEVKITYQDIIDRCEKLSSFEADGKYDANGESRYLEIHINEVDKILVKQYIKQARGVLEERMERMIDKVVDVLTDNTQTLSFDGILDFIRLQEWLDGQIQGGSIAFVRNFSDTEGNNDIFQFCHYRNGAEDMYVLDRTVPFGYESNKDTIYIDNEGHCYKWNASGSDIEQIENVDCDFKWVIRTDTRWKENNILERHIKEAIVAYTMAAWLSDKLPERVAFYDTLYNNSVNLAIKNIFTKQAPKYV